MTIFRYRSADRRSLRNWSEAEILKSSQAVNCAIGDLILFQIYFAVGEIDNDVESGPDFIADIGDVVCGCH